MPISSIFCVGFGSGQVASVLIRGISSWHVFPIPHVFWTLGFCDLDCVWFTCLGISVLYLSLFLDLSPLLSSASELVHSPECAPFGGFFGSAMLANKQRGGGVF